MEQPEELRTAFGRVSVAQGRIPVQFDAQLLAWQVRGGISNYFANLVAEFESDHHLEVRALGVPQYTQNPQAIALGMGRPLPRGVPRRVRAIRALNAPGQLAALLRRPAVLHSTYYANARLRSAGGAARAVTVYDMIPEKFPELFPDGNPHQFKLEHVREADIIFCISETTRDDLVEMVPASADRIRVTPLGVSDEYLEPVALASASDERPYLLFVGMRTFHKNFDVVLRAMADVPPEIDLVLAGGGPLNAQEHERAAALGIAHRIRQTTPSDEALRQLYRSALGFVFSSRYEGFGLPVIEAMASGTPTILSRTPVFEEIAGPDALYFDPDDDAALAKAVSRLVEDGTSRSALVAAGRLRARRFTWAATAAATAEGYREVARAR